MCGMQEWRIRWWSETHRSDMAQAALAMRDCWRWLAARVATPALRPADLDALYDDFARIEAGLDAARRILDMERPA